MQTYLFGFFIIVMGLLAAWAVVFAHATREQMMDPRDKPYPADRRNP